MITVSLNKSIISNIKSFVRTKHWTFFVFPAACVTAILATLYSLSRDIIVAYGDAESHLNIAKRVVSSLTPGLAQIGGVWLPLPHLLMVPFVFFDPLWRTGLAGSIVSGLSYILTAIFLYKMAFLITKNKISSLVASFVFIFNPNILYLQSTPMTELPLIAFFTVSIYYFIHYTKEENLNSLIISALFGFAAALSRYDGWFLVFFECLSLLYLGIRNKWTREKIEGIVIIFATLSLFSICLWLLWDKLILGDPFYFTNSQFSAKSQQLGWLQKGQLPSYHNIISSFLYYTVTALSTSGLIIFSVAVIGFILFNLKKEVKDKLIISVLICNPFIFYVATLFMGQSIIFIPHLTPPSFEWTLFNARYGAMMVPAAALFAGFAFLSIRNSGKALFGMLCLLQVGLFVAGYSPVITQKDGVSGLSQAKRPDAEHWLSKNYDNGLVLMDDYSRLISIVRSGIPLQNIIYIGNRNYWETSITTPQKYAKWVIVQKNDAIWKSLYETKEKQDRLYTFYQKVYTSPDILIFRRIS